MLPMAGGLPKAVLPRSMSMLIAIDATFVDSAQLATMFFAAASTLSSADKGEGVKTGGNEGEFMATNNFALSSTFPVDYALVRAKPLPHLGKYLLLSFKKRLREISVGETQLCLAELAIFMFWLSSIEYARVEKMFEM